MNSSKEVSLLNKTDISIAVSGNTQLFNLTTALRCDEKVDSRPGLNAELLLVF